MFKILQRYVLREVLVPAFMALGILTFLVLTRTIFADPEQIPGAITLSTSLKMLCFSLPTFLALTIPMSLLVGVLLGIGRLTVDSEVKACRTHGVNLFRTFLPVLALGAAMAALEVWNCADFAPRMMARNFSLLQKIAVDLANGLEPGKFLTDLGFQGRNAVLYFQDKDAKTGSMSNLYVSIDAPAGKRSGGGVSDFLGGGKKPQARPAAGLTSATLASAAAPTTATRPAVRKDATPPSATPAAVSKMLCLAATGEVMADPVTRRAGLVLHNGTLHFLQSCDDPRYSTMEFATMTLDMDLPGGKNGNLGDWRETASARTSWELLAHIRELRDSLPEEMRGDLRKAEARIRSEEQKLSRKDPLRAKIGDIWHLRGEVYSRISVSLACFAFVLIGVPLAVYIRPSGKAVGVSISFALFLVYYGFLYAGVHLMRKGVVAGPFLVLLPIVLLTAVGAVLLYRVVRR